MNPFRNDILPDEMLALFRGGPSAVVSFLLKEAQAEFGLYGETGVGGDCEPEDVIFEIGSISKVFAGILLAVLVEEGRIDPDRPLGDVVPGLICKQAWLTPHRLATHSAGLPKLHIPYWKALMLPTSDDPYADFSREDLFRWIRNWRKSSEPKAGAYAYSNLGFGLLGEALAALEGRDYGDLLREKVLEPMGLTDTSADLTSDRAKRFAQPYDTAGRRVQPWTFKAIAAAGALRATPRDMARFASRVVNAIREPRTALDRAICRSARPPDPRSMESDGAQFIQCLGWISIQRTPGTAAVLFHNGGTAGMTSELYICPQKQAAIGIFANRGVAAGFWSGLKLAFVSPQKAANDLFDALPAD